MASGTGTFHSSNYHAATSTTGVKCSARVSLSVNATTRTATITVDAMMSFYRISGNWNLANGTDITYDGNTGYYVYGNIDGETQTAYKLGIVGAKSFTATTGGTYTQTDGYIKSRSGYNSWVTATKTFTFPDSGAAISKSWSATVYYRGTTMSLSGTVTTDPIAPVYTFVPKVYIPVNGRAKRVKKLYCSVGGQAKQIKKLYASVNGEAKLIYDKDVT